MNISSGRAGFTRSNRIFHGDFSQLPLADRDEKLAATIRVTRERPLPHWRGKNIKHLEHGELYGAAGRSISLIADFAAEHGLRVIDADRNRRHVFVRGSVREFERAFRTELRVAQINGRKRRVRQGHLTLPREIVPFVTSVTGLDNRPFAKPHYRIGRAAAHAAAAGSSAAPVLETAFTPLEIASLYNFPAGFDGAGQTIAILELDGGFRPEELTAYFKTLGIPAPSVEVIRFEHGGSNNPGTNALDPFCRDPEVMLDIQLAAAIAPGARILVYFAADDSDDSYLAALSAIIHDTVNRPDIISTSWGGPESTATQQFRDELNQLLESAAHLGITVCAATGDNASPDFSGDDPGWDKGAHVDFPASSPWVLACGGTRISVNGNAIVNEDVWFDGHNDGTGGGISRFFDRPDYQAHFALPHAVNPDGPVKRGIPDVAANAAPASGYRILCNGQNFPDPSKGVPPMGGTSAVAPIWAALVARCNQALGRRCGFLNPELYEIAASASHQVFRNPTGGANGDYLAGAGWNACTGLGSVDGTRLLNALR